MKYSYAALALTLAVAQAQNLANLPPCSINCFTSALLSDGCASLTDFRCHCSKPELIGQVQPCVQAACSPQEVATVLSAAQQLCAGVGVPITIPSTGGASTTAAAAPQESSTAAEESAAASPTAEETTAVAQPTESPTTEEGIATIQTLSPSYFPATETEETASPTETFTLIPPTSTVLEETTTSESGVLIPPTSTILEETTTSESGVLIPPTSTVLEETTTTSAATTSGVAQPTTGFVGGNVTTTTTPLPFTGAANHINGASFSGLLGLIIAAVYVL